MLKLLGEVIPNCITFMVVQIGHLLQITVNPKVFSVFFYTTVQVISLPGTVFRAWQSLVFHLS